jgi:putative oxidoreductase
MNSYFSRNLVDGVHQFIRGLDSIGAWLPPLGLRCLLAYEFWTSGIEKLNGANWFTEIQDAFPFPLNLVPVEISWQLATWFEIIGPIALVLGLATRFFAASLSILTIVAIISVHAGLGYNVCDQGWKLPAIYLVMFLPLMFSGPGKLSLDHWVRLRWGRDSRKLWS